jgi:hypothetical protein
MIQDYISFKIFFVSFAIGLLFVYLIGPEIKTIYIYPTPENVEKILFKDKADNCFYFEPDVLECPKDSTLISTIPMQT